MRYTIRYSNLFKKSFKKCLKRGCKEEEILIGYSYGNKMIRNLF